MLCFLQGAHDALSPPRYVFPLAVEKKDLPHDHPSRTEAIPRLHRIAWLLELLGLDYRTDIIERDAGTSLAPEGLRRIHPLGKSPVL